MSGGGSDISGIRIGAYIPLGKNSKFGSKYGNSMNKPSVSNRSVESLSQKEKMFCEATSIIGSRFIHRPSTGA